ncbi:hypothetical protein Bbelb_089460 [Branchiostoma belcheri]|nr:hypothetical protein Bbelb_089460 [Branchiostoma belcheri]
MRPSPARKWKDGTLDSARWAGFTEVKTKNVLANNERGWRDKDCPIATDSVVISYIKYGSGTVPVHAARRTGHVPAVFSLGTSLPPCLGRKPTAHKTTAPPMLNSRQAVSPKLAQPELD